MRDWERVIDLAGPVIRLSGWGKYRTPLGLSLAILARAVVAIDPQASARLQAAARRLMTPARQHDSEDAARASPTSPAGTATETSRSSGLIAGVYRETSGILRETVGEARLRELRAEGATIDDEQIVDVALGAITRAQSARRP
jgi:hypothetical protein